MRVLILILSLLLWCQVGWAEISQEDGTRAVLGEAGPKYEEKLAIAYATLNRGTLTGVYGAKNALKRSISGDDWQIASKAWNQALLEPMGDITHGATHWLSDYDLAQCRPSRMAWRHSMVETAYYGTTHFYKERG